MKTLVFPNILLMVCSLTFVSCIGDDEGGFQTVPAFKGGLLDANVGGEKQPNQVYIDLSTNTSTAILRSTWDLGFYSGQEFRVIINSSVAMMAYRLDKNEIDKVGHADTLGLGDQLSLEAVFGALFGPPVPWLSEASTWIDNPSRDLDLTAIDEVMEQDSDNMVYIINRGNDEENNSRGWKKIQIKRNGNGYDLLYGDIGDTQHSTLTIQKDPDYNFSFFHFSNGLVDVEPKAAEWDLAFTTWTELTELNGDDIPYFFKDYVIINQKGVSVAKVPVNDETKTLEEFNEFSGEDVADLNFSDSVNFIGDSWRTIATPTPGSVTSVRNDRFFVLRDSQNNTYKLIFTAMLSDQGERGFPQILFDLL